MLQVPGVLASVSVIADATPFAHTAVGPPMAAGNGLTVTDVETWQPVAVLVKVTGCVPADTPLNTPLLLPTVTYPGTAEALHVPGVLASASVEVEPAHNVVVPVIADGSALTMMDDVVKQPVAVLVNVIVAVPAAPPVSTPLVGTMVAVPAGAALHVPATLVSVMVTAESEQTAAGPEIGPGNAFTVTRVDAMQPVGDV